MNAAKEEVLRILELLPEAWLVDLTQRVIEIYQDPSEKGYRVGRIFHSGDSLSPQAFPDLELTVDAILR